MNNVIAADIAATVPISDIPSALQRAAQQQLAAKLQAGDEGEGSPTGLTDNETIAHQASRIFALLQSLGWIVNFCSEHPEWFGQGGADEGAEHEWLFNANKLIKQPSDTKLLLNGWGLGTSKDGQYLYVERTGSSGQIHVKAGDEGVVVDIWSDNEDPEVIATAAATYSELERE
jgi:hypothetical protein